MSRPRHRDRSLQEARALVDAHLRDCAGQEVLFMADLAYLVEARRGAALSGLRGALFESVFEYACLLPAHAEAGHVALGLGSSMYSVLNPYFEGEGRAQLLDACATHRLEAEHPEGFQRLTGPGVSARQGCLPF